MMAVNSKIKNRMCKVGNFLQYIIYTDVMLLASLAWTRKGHPPFWIRAWAALERTGNFL